MNEKDFNRNPGKVGYSGEGTDKEEEKIRVDGFGQVLALLRVADPAFRESLLRRLAARDPELARNLIRNLGKN